MKKGLHTKKNAWDKAADLEVWRGSEKLDPGVNFFVLMLNQMGFDTAYSCEGHPNGCYVTFRAPYEAAIEIHAAGYFSVEIEGDDYWSLRRHMGFTGSPAERIDAFRWAADAWEKRFGTLDFETAVLVID